MRQAGLPGRGWNEIFLPEAAAGGLRIVFAAPRAAGCPYPKTED